MTFEEMLSGVSLISVANKAASRSWGEDDWWDDDYGYDDDIYPDCGNLGCYGDCWIIVEPDECPWCGDYGCSGDCQLTCDNCGSYSCWGECMLEPCPNCGDLYCYGSCEDAYECPDCGDPYCYGGCYDDGGGGDPPPVAPDGTVAGTTIKTNVPDKEHVKKDGDKYAKGNNTITSTSVQSPKGCVPASTSYILEHYGIDKGERTITREIIGSGIEDKSIYRTGVDMNNFGQVMDHYFNTQTCTSDTDVVAALDRGNFVTGSYLVEVTISDNGSAYEERHAITIIGYRSETDSEGDAVTTYIYMDTSYGELREMSADVISTNKEITGKK